MIILESREEASAFTKRIEAANPPSKNQKKKGLLPSRLNPITRVGWEAGPINSCRTGCSSIFSQVVYSYNVVECLREK